MFFVLFVCCFFVVVVFCVFVLLLFCCCFLLLFFVVVVFLGVFLCVCVWFFFLVFFFWGGGALFAVQKCETMASLCRSACMFETYKVANPEDRFSRDIARYLILFVCTSFSPFLEVSTLESVVKYK